MDGPKQKDNSPTDWQREYRKQERYYAYFIKKYDTVMEERAFFKQQAYRLEGELGPLQRKNYEAHKKINRLEEQVTTLQEENRRLKKQLDTVKTAQPEEKRPLPSFVKANVPLKRRKRPGREVGHPGAFRPMPQKIDREIDVPFARNAAGVCCCPKCRCQLLKVKKRRRIVEDIVPSEPVVECYNTEEGYCPKCGKVVETRSAEQPPAADIPGPQVGINTLAMAAVLRVVYRLPYEPITQLLADLSGLKLSNATIARQMQRMSRRLE